MDCAPQLSPKLVDSLDLIRSMGVEPTDAEIVWLAELRRRADTPPGREVVSSASSPIEIHGVRFWPLHLLAEAWFADWFRAFEDDELVHCGVYMMSHAMSQPGNKALRDLSQYDQVRRSVLDWLAELPIPRSDFAQVMDALFRLDNGDEMTVTNPDAKPETTQATEETLEDKAARLCKLFEGTTPSYWMTEVSKAEAMRMAMAVSERESGGEWSRSPLRTRRVGSYLAAVKTIVRRGVKANG